MSARLALVRRLPVALLAGWLGAGVSLVHGQTSATSATPATNSPAGETTNSPRQAAAPTPAPAANTTNAPVQLDYKAFSLVSDRNIFNANRTRRSSRGGAGGDRAAAPRVDSFTLLGTLSYSKGDFAFFDGSASSYKKALKPKDRIADYQITAILPNAVRLESAGKTVEVLVGARMRREDDGPWQLDASGVAKAATPNGAATSETNSADAGGDNDILKRLLQRREQEEN